MTRYVTDDFKIMTNRAIKDFESNDEDGFINDLSYILKNLKPIDSKIYAKYLFSKLDCVKENVKNDTQTDLRKIEDTQAEINRLREALKSQIKALLALKGFYPETYLFVDDNIRRIKQALNGKSE